MQHNKILPSKIKSLTAIILFTLLSGAQLKAHDSDLDVEHQDIEYAEEGFDNSLEDVLNPLGCTAANRQEISVVDSGNQKKFQFLKACYEQTDNSSWCDQLVRPNPSSKNTFQCTYGSNQVHQLIHPSETTWKHAIGAVKLIQKLAKKGLKTCQIYNWWRPEPYNANVGGAAGRHPFGTSVDVRLCSNSEAIKAFDELCKERKAGNIRAIGYYGGTALHFGVGDRTANTWGRSCPN